ncbi:MAG: protein-disulfide reductase DsbD family protein [Acidobacteriota bacterium]|nr:protein-disulfide reductase DsbD family protein [Acidobacteriota bacterium]
MKTAGKIAMAVCVLHFSAGFAAGAAENGLVRAELISEALSVRPGSVVTIALRLEVAEGWHIYWKNPGDSGLPTRVEWILPDGVGASGMSWPAPRKFDEDAAVTFGYESSVDLLVEVEVFCGFPAEPFLNIGARVEWLACRDGCIPGSSEVDLVIPVTDHESLRDSRHEAYFNRVRGDMPRIARNWQVSAAAEPDRIVLSIGLPTKPQAAPEQVVFFPENEGVIDHGAPQIFREEDDGYVLVMSPSPFAAAPPARLRGVLASSNGWRLEEQGSAVLVDVPLTRKELPISEPGSDPAKRSR